MSKLTDLEAQIQLADGCQKIDLLLELSCIPHDQTLAQREAHAVRALKIAEAVPDRARVGSCHKHLARIYGFQLKKDQAIASAEQAKEYFLAMNQTTELADITATLAEVWFRSGQFDTALTYCQSAVKAFASTGHLQKEWRMCLTMSDIYSARGEYQQAVEFGIKCLKMSEQLADDTKIAHSLTRLGIAHFNLTEYHQAQDYFKKALSICKETTDWGFLASVYMNIGNTYTHLKEFDPAVQFYQKALHIHEKAGYDEGILSTMYNMACVYWDSGQRSKAVAYIYRGLDIILRSNSTSMWTVNFLRGLGQAHLNSDEYEKAEAYLKKALKIASENGSKHQERFVYQYLAELNEKQGNHKQALINFKKQIELEREAFNETKSKQIADIKTQYETEKKEADLQKAQEELQLLAKHMSSKNKIIEDLQRKIQQIEVPPDPACQVKMEQIMNYIDQSKTAREEWVNFQLYFDRAYPGFLQKLSDTYPTLTRQELKGCALIKAGMTTKQMAETLHISYRSTDNLRNRTRKKLQLTRDVTLNEFIHAF